MKYEVTGNIILGISTKPFKVQIIANSEKHAKDKVYTKFGAMNKLKKGNVRIKNVSIVQ
jgi:ribosomal protein L20A (L18A)